MRPESTVNRGQRWYRAIQGLICTQLAVVQSQQCKDRLGQEYTLSTPGCNPETKYTNTSTNCGIQNLSKILDMSLPILTYFLKKVTPVFSKVVLTNY